MSSHDRTATSAGADAGAGEGRSQATAYNPDSVVTSAADLTALVGTPKPAQLTKCLDRLDDHCRRWIGASPFVIVSSCDRDGRMDVSPKGDPAGFVSILDDRTLAIPDRRGNHRLDTFRNIIQNPQVAVVFLVPGRGETLRVAGRAVVVTDEDLLATMAERGTAPKLAMVVEIDEVMFHCGKSIIRSGLWEASAWPDTAELASYAQCLADQTAADETVDEMEARFASWHEGNELY